MNGIEEGFSAINKSELESTISTIAALSSDYQNIEAKMAECIENLSLSIISQGKKTNNNNVAIKSNIKTLQTNVEKSLEVFQSLIQKYTTASENSIKYIEGKKDELWMK